MAPSDKTESAARKLTAEQLKIVFGGAGPAPADRSMAGAEAAASITAAESALGAAAMPYVGWLGAASQEAQGAAGQAAAASSAFETAMSATVESSAVAANRAALATLASTNFLGMNTPAIAATESAYTEMWAQDVSAMASYDGASAAPAAPPEADKGSK